MTKSEKNHRNIINKIRDVLAITVWAYAFIKLFVFDVDAYFLKIIMPGWEWLLSLKFLFLAGTLAILWLALGHKHFVISIIYILFFPFIVVFWKFPKLIWRKWAAFFVLLPTLYNTIVTLRSTFVLYTFAVISATIIFISKSPYFLAPSMLYLVIFLSVVLFRSLRMAHSSSLFSQLAKLTRQLLPKINNGELDDPIQPTIPNENAEVEKLDENDKPKPDLPPLYLLHVGADYVIGKVEGAMIDRKYNSFLVIAFLNALFQTTFVFSLENWALYKINPNSFKIIGESNFALFFAYSFGQIVTANLTAIQPVNSLATFIATIEVFSGIVILVVGAFSLLTAARDSYREDIQELSDSVRDVATAIDQRIQTKFSLTALQLEISIAEHSVQMVNLLRRWRGLTELPEFNNKSDEEPPNLQST